MSSKNECASPWENITIPVGPEEVAEEWRSQARLAIAIHGAVCWNQSCNTRMAFLTRVQEKGSLWTVYMMEQAIAKCFELGMCERSDTVVIWSDGAPHYRSIGTISGGISPESVALVLFLGTAWHTISRERSMAFRGTQPKVSTSTEANGSEAAHASARHVSCWCKAR